MLEYLARLEIHDLEAAKLWLLGLYVISLIGIVLGVYWEHEDFEKSKRHIGWRLLIGSLAFETLLTVLIFVADAEISRRQKAEIAQLEWLVGGRQLAPAQIEAIARDLVQFSGRKLFITSYAGDGRPDWHCRLNPC